MAAITATTQDFGHEGQFKVCYLTFTASGAATANVAETITIPFKKVRHVIGGFQSDTDAATAAHNFSFNESTGVLTLNVCGAVQHSVKIVGF
jgi:hypothetical protein